MKKRTATRSVKMGNRIYFEANQDMPNSRLRAAYHASRSDMFVFFEQKPLNDLM